MKQFCFVIITISNFLFACNQRKEEISFKAVAKVVPHNFIPTTDSFLQKIKDTIYYKQQKFSGFIYALYPTKDTAFVFSYADGVEEGMHKKWYANKQLAEERYYNNGKKEGVHKGWWQNGQVQYEYEISKDIYTGIFKEWNEQGVLIKFFHYKNGQEEGSQKLFYDNGSVRSNYVIANGRRYGLLGTKNCANVKDSVITM